MTRLGIHRRDHPPRRGAPSDPPPARAVAGLDVLARHQRQQRHRVALGVVKVEILCCADQLEGVVDELADEAFHVGGVAPVHHRAAGAQVAVPHPHLSQPFVQPADPPDLVHQHRDGVLTGHSVIKNRGIEHPPMALRCRPALSDQLAHHPEHPIRITARTQTIAPQRQHRVTERLISQRQTRSSLPPDICRQPPARLTIRQTLQRLEHHHGRDHLTRHRRTPPTRPEQISEQPVRKQTTAMLSQERVHRAHTHQMPAQRPRIQKLTIQTARTLHAHILPRAHPQHAEIRPNKSAHS